MILPAPVDLSVIPRMLNWHFCNYKHACEPLPHLYSIKVCGTIHLSRQTVKGKFCPCSTYSSQINFNFVTVICIINIGYFTNCILFLLLLLFGTLTYVTWIYLISSCVGLVSNVVNGNDPTLTTFLTSRGERKECIYHLEMDVRSFWILSFRLLNGIFFPKIVLYVCQHWLSWRETHHCCLIFKPQMGLNEGLHTGFWNLSLNLKNLLFLFKTCSIFCKAFSFILPAFLFLFFPT